MQKFKVTAEDNNIRLDRWFKRNKPEVNHGLLQKLLRQKKVKLNGKRAETSSRIEEGDEIIIFQNVEKRDDGNYIPKKGNISENEVANFKKLIIFENSDLLIINKPHGLASQGGSGIKISVDDIIRAISDRYKLVHRLDRETSGVLVIAKKTSVAAQISELIRAHKIEKIYWAIVRGNPPQPEGKIVLPLAKSGGKNEKMIVSKEGKYARTEYRMLEDYAAEFSLLELRPITGRTHQLRVHCAEIGCPIMGDGKYGGTEAFRTGMSDKLHLHARQIIIPSLKINVTAPVPEHMKELAD